LVFGILVWGFSLSACAAVPQPTPTPPLTHLLTYTPSLLPTSTPAPTDTGWLSTTPGLDRREIAVPFPEGFAERVILFRIDPAFFSFRVLYTPGFPRLVSEWGASAGARLVFNAGYFDEKSAALGLLVSDGKFFGKSYEGFGGMFAVDASGLPAIRSLAAQPYQPGEALMQAVQNFPLLIYPDGPAYAKEDGARARRTALGQDVEGRLYLIIAPHDAFTLSELGAWLRASDLGLTLAVNLDGGGSTGYYAGPGDTVDSITPIPAVVAVYAK